MRNTLSFPFLMPLLAAGVMSMSIGAHGARAAAPMTPAQALRILAQARAMDSKCKFLDEGSHMELSDYVAKAEVATAARQGVDTADQAIQAGKKAGKASTCDSGGEELVTAALQAAREAMRQARSAQSAPRSSQPRRRMAQRQAAERNVRLVPRRSRERIVAYVRPPHRERAMTPGGQIGRYVAMTSDYYLARRCKTLGYAQAMRLWKRVKNAHYALMRSAGPAVVARAKARAIARAARRSCGARLAAR
jgi:hypothetical protein